MEKQSRSEVSEGEITKSEEDEIIRVNTTSPRQFAVPRLLDDKQVSRGGHILETRKQEIDLIYLNGQSLLKNLDEIGDLTITYKPSIVAVVETHVTVNILDKEIYIKGYSSIRCNSNSRHTGGVVIYVQSELKYEVIFNESQESCFWAIGLRITMSTGRRYLILALYRSPNSNPTEFIEFFNTKLEGLNYKYMGITNIIVGDFNFNYLKSELNVNKLKHLIEINGFEQIIKEPTRITRNSETLIDYVITNKRWKVNVVTKGLPSISDHETISIQFLDNRDQTHGSKDKEVCKYDWKKFDREKFQFELTCKDYNNQSNDIEVLSNCLRPTVNIKKTMDDNLPKKVIHLKGKRNPWINVCLRKEMKERDILLL